MSLPADPTPPEKAPVRSLALRGQHALAHPALRDERAAEIEDDGLDLRDLLRVVRKHKWMLLAITLLCGVIAAVHSLRATPMYRASAMVQIDRTTQRVVAFNQELDTEQVWDDGSQLQTQIELLKSRALAERVIDEMGLNRRKAADGLPGAGDGSGLGSQDEASAAPQGFIDRLLSNYRQLGTPAIQDEQVLSRDGAVGAFRGSVSIEPVRNSRLVNIVVVNSNPELASRIANTMARTFMAMNLERRLESSTYARSFLEDQIRSTKARLEESERVINEYAKRNQILTLDDKTEVATQGFASISAALARAEEERIRAESVYNEVLRNPESAPQVLDNRAVQTFKEQRAKLQAEYTVNEAVFKPDFPRMVQMRTQIADLDARIDAEVKVVLGSVRAQFEAARQQENLLRTRLAQSRAEVQVVQDRSVDLNLMRREMETNRQVYDSLLQRLKEVSVTGGLTTNNISVVDEARPPLFPFSPQPMRYAMIGMGLGLLLGLGLAFLREMLDDTVKSAEEIEQLYGLPLLGLIPLARKKLLRGAQAATLVHSDPRGPFAEAYRSMRTALQFSTTDGAPKVLMVTSCGKAEGKSTTAISLAINFAQLGKPVLLIDADMRNPSVHRIMKMPNELGLSNFLAGDTGSGTLIQNANVSNLSVLTAGPTPPDPVELLSGPKLMLLLEKAHAMGFAQVIIDSPPLLGIADAVVLGNQVPYLVFAIKAGETRKSAIRDSLRRLRHAGIVPMGMVLTHVSDKHGAEYGYGNGSYYGYHEKDPVATRPAAQGSGFGTSPSETGEHRAPEPKPALASKGLVWSGAALAGLALIGLITWALWPAGSTEAAAAASAAPQRQVVAAPVTLGTPATTTETAPVQASTPVAQVVPTSMQTSTQALPATGAQAPEAGGRVPRLAELKDTPADLWPMLAQLWKADFSHQNACESMTTEGLQCFRLPDASVDLLRRLDRPGLVKLRRGDLERWVLLHRLDDRTASFQSGALTWSQPVTEFEQQWTGAYTTVWRLPPGHRSRVFAARADDASGRWLDEQLKSLPDVKGGTFEERVRAFQTAYGLLGDGRASPSTFVLVNRLVERDEPRLR